MKIAVPSANPSPKQPTTKWDLLASLFAGLDAIHFVISGLLGITFFVVIGYTMAGITGAILGGLALPAAVLVGLLLSSL